MEKAEVVIDQEECQGCGYCVKFCSRGCLEIPGNKFTPKGYVLASFVNPEKCTACGICVWMCPANAIEVYTPVHTIEDKV